MIGLFVGLSVLLLLFISGIHIFWAFGGKWGSNAVIPTNKSQQPTFAPGAAATIIVALLLFGAAILLMLQGRLLPSVQPYPIVRWGCWICLAVFGLRSIGDFKYVGLFKRMRSSRFARYDTKLFTPLCLWFCVMFYLVIRLG